MMWFLIPIAIIAALLGRRSVTHNWQVPKLLGGRAVTASQLLDDASEKQKLPNFGGREFFVYNQSGTYVTAFPARAQRDLWLSRNPGHFYLVNLDDESTQERK